MTLSKLFLLGLNFLYLSKSNGDEWVLKNRKTCKIMTAYVLSISKQTNMSV